MKDRSSAAVPAAWLAKLKVSVCQPLATVTVASVSTDRVRSAASSTLSRTGMPATGDHTRADIVVSVLENGSRAMASLGHTTSVVPAQTSAVSLLTMRATLFVASVGSTTTVASPAPPNPTSVGAGLSSNVTSGVRTTTTVVS